MQNYCSIQPVHRLHPISAAGLEENHETDGRNGGVRVKRRRLTREQEELRLSGLRILARLIARRWLADLQPDADASHDADGRSVEGTEAALEEDAA